jgi:hypothetical protein
MRVTGGRQEPYVFGSLGGGVVSLVPAPVVPNAAKVPAIADVKGDYELVAQIGTARAWEVFLTTYPTGFYAELAREQIAKLSPKLSLAAAEADRKVPDTKPVCPAGQTPEGSVCVVISHPAKTNQAVHPQDSERPAPRGVQNGLQNRAKTDLKPTLNVAKPAAAKSAAAKPAAAKSAAAKPAPAKPVTVARMQSATTSASDEAPDIGVGF